MYIRTSSFVSFETYPIFNKVVHKSRFKDLPNSTCEKLDKIRFFLLFDMGSDIILKRINQYAQQCGFIECHRYQIYQNLG